jgi:hypothetical protein
LTIGPPALCSAFAGADASAVATAMIAAEERVSFFMIVYLISKLPVTSARPNSRQNNSLFRKKIFVPFRREYCCKPLIFAHLSRARIEGQLSYLANPQQLDFKIGVGLNDDTTAYIFNIRHSFQLCSLF